MLDLLIQNALVFRPLRQATLLDGYFRLTLAAFIVGIYYDESKTIAVETVFYEHVLYGIYIYTCNHINEGMPNIRSEEEVSNKDKKVVPFLHTSSRCSPPAAQCRCDERPSIRGPRC